MIVEDFKELGYIFQWSKMSAQHYLLPQRRCRVYGLADLDEGQDSEVFSSMMYHTLDSMSSDVRFNLDDIFDANLPTAPPRGNAEKNVNQALQRTAVKNESTNVFVDTSTSASWEAEYAENMLTCIRPSHPIFSVKYNRYITVAEMFKCQGIFKQDFQNPAVLDEILKQSPGDAQDLCGNAFASTCAQAQLLASLVNASGWTHIGASDVSKMETNVAESPVPNKVSLDALASSESISAHSCSNESKSTSPRVSPSKRKSSIQGYLTPSGKRSKFDQAPAAKQHKAGF